MDNNLWKSLNDKSRFIETEMDTLARKRTGSYYTDLRLTDVMMTELVNRMKENGKKLIECRFFEPCVGAGNFVFSYIDAVRKIEDINREDAEILLNNIYVADVNQEALKGYKESLRELAYAGWGIELTSEYFELHCGSGLLVDVTAPELRYISIQEIFSSKIFKNGFDVVATNPPYKNLKAERNQYGTEDEYLTDKDKYSCISDIVADRFLYSTDGVLNLYKLFVEEIIDRYANENAYVSLLIPSSIMSDKTCQKLRTHILKDSSLLSIKVIGEGSGYIDAQQALSAILLHKGEATETVQVVKDYCNKPDDVAEVAIADILNENTGNAIIAVSKEEYIKLRKLRTFPVIKELNFIINLRGELDLTANKKNIVDFNTGYPLLRGRNIGYYSLLETDEKEYVLSDFVESTKKKCYIESERIICQQIANMNKERRVTFSLTPANYVLGNSCNFISIKDKYGTGDVLVVLSVLYPWADLKNNFHIDHMYPKSKFTPKKLEKKGVPADKIDFYIENVNFLGNLQLLEATPNEEKNNKDFDEWLKETFATPDQLKAYKEKHYIPDVDLSFGNFEEFLTEREKLIVAALKKELM